MTMLRTLVPIVPLLLVSTATAQLAGAYTINPTVPTGGSNFGSLADATAALAAQGVAGPVFLYLYDDAGPYTESAPFTTANVQYAPSDAVLTMTSWLGASSVNRITFLPAAGERPVFDATGRGMGVFWGGADYVTLQGVEIANATFDAISLYAEAAHGVAEDAIIDGCMVHDCGGTGVTLYGNSAFPVNTVVQNCWFWRLQTTNAGGFNTLGRFGYVTTRRSTNARIVHNTFVADTGVGSMFCVIGAYPSGTTEQPFAEVSNNVIVKSTNAAAPIYRIVSPAGGTITGPVVADANCFHDPSGGPFALWGSGGATSSPTLLDWQTNALRDLVSIEGDPLFRDLATHDLHLTPTSPCVGASQLAANVAADFDGQPRTTTIDIGADEFSGALATAVGAGCAGSGNLTPAMTSNWPFLGNGSFALFLDDLPPGAIAVLFGSVGLSPTPIPFGGGCTIYLAPATLTSLTAVLAGPVGTASVGFQLPANPAFVGVNLGYQSLVLDAGAPIGLTFTNALDVVFDF